MTNVGYKKKLQGNYRVYEINWSPYVAADKFTILKTYTEMTGIYVVFYLNKFKRLTPCMIGGAWFTGLRPTLLKLYHRLPSDTMPLRIYNQIQAEKIYIKAIEVYDLGDFTDILFSLKDKYPQAFLDTNGIPPTPDPDNVKTIDINTKIYYKQKKDLDI